MSGLALATYVRAAEPRHFNAADSTRANYGSWHPVTGQPSPWGQDVVATSKSNKQFMPPAPSPANDMLARLRQFKKWHENWDGEGAPAPDRDAVETAIDLLSFLQAARKHFAVHLNADSKPVFFLRDSEWAGEIIVEDECRISFDFRQGERMLFDYDVEFMNCLPASLTDALKAV